MLRMLQARAARPMRKAKITFRPQAETDLFDLYHYIAQESGFELAGQYIDRIEEACLALATFPERGRKRDDIRPGLRILGFERRASLVFQVKRTEVVVIRVLYGGQDLERILRMHED
jgi:toxin ParE1/3/4